MFTGIVEELGSVAWRDGGRLRINAEVVVDDIAMGESIAVNGCCLTVVGWGTDDGRSWWEADVVDETFARTSLKELGPGSPVNLERPVRLQDRLGGHLVQGHVDGVVRVLERRDEGPGARLRLALPGPLAPFVVGQGAVALDGVSLTVAQRGADAFEVMLIPETLRVTTLGARRAGESVNLEVDLVGRYVVAAMAGREVTA
jgi:riboflavin synthase